MAESNTGEESSNWWGSWITSAKAKSASVFEAVKKDLDEISTAVRTEVSNAGAMIGETLKLDEPESTANTVKRSFSSFIDQVTEVLVPSQEDEDAEAVLITSDGIVTLTGFQKHLAEVQLNDKTYTEEPNEHLTENYQRWLEVVEQDQFTQSRLTKHLTNSEILNEKYLSLVPEHVSHMEFWKRYLFKRALLEDALANAEIAERKANVIEQETIEQEKSNIIQMDQPKKVVNDDDLFTDLKSNNEPVSTTINPDETNWNAEDFGTEEISEEEQARLLQEYEKEIQEREAKKTENKVKQTKNLAPTTVTKNQAKQRSTTNKKTPIKNATSTTTTAMIPTTTTMITPPSPDSTQQPSSGSNKDSIVPIQKNHFTLENKDDAASDESWEKDFDMSDK